MKHLYQLLLVSVAMVAACCAQAQSKQPAAPDDATTSVYKKNGSFAPNLGQVVDENYQPVTNVLAKSSLPGLDIYLTQTGVTYVLLNYELDSAASVHPVYQTNNNHFKVHYSRVDVNLVGATLTQSQLVFGKPDSYKASYYYGDIKAEAVSQYKDVTVKNVYPGIDWHWFINSAGQPEYDFVVHAGYSSSAIKMQYQYADITPGTDNILISTRNGALREGTLKAFAGGSKVQAAYTYNKAQNQITFNIGSYNIATDLVIDPPLQLQWSTQYGGSFADGLRGVATANHKIYLAGYTTSANFPVYRADTISYFDHTFNGNTDAVLLMVSDSQNLMWATYMGGPGNDFANSIDVNPTDRCIAITGGAQSGFPVTNLSQGYKDTTAAATDIFIARFSAANILVWSTFYGGNGTEEGLRIDYGNSLCVTGYTNSGSSFPLKTAGTYTRSPANSFNNPFILQFNMSAIAELNWATGLRDTANAYGTAIDVTNHIIVGGFSYSPVLNYFGGNPLLLTNNGGVDGFLVHFMLPGVPEFERFLGGTGNDYITDLVSHPYGCAVTGYTNSIDFPVLQSIGIQYRQTQLAGSYDAFVALFENDTTITWSTYYGGNAMDVATGIDRADAKLAITGFTYSANFPVDTHQNGNYLQTINKGNSDGFVTAFTLHGIRTYSTYKGDSCYEYPADIAFDTASLYICGEGLFACNQSLPDSMDLHSGGGGNGGGNGGVAGFCWGFGSTAGSAGGGLGSCLQVNVGSVTPTCSDAIVGIGYASAIVTHTNGVPPYTIFWSNGETSDTALMLTKGKNYVVVQDTNGCAGEALFSVFDRVFSYSTTAGNCITYGTAVAQMYNGTEPLRYVWSTGDTTANISAPSGTYFATVTDAMGCIVAGIVTIPTLNTTTYDILVKRRPGCGNSNGILVACLVGNNNHYYPTEVAWYDSANNYLGTYDTIYNLPPGTYHIGQQVCINNQLVYPTVTLTDPGIITNIQVGLQQLTPAGCLYPSGIAGATVTGSSYSPYMYEWSNYITEVSYQSTVNRSLLSYGNTYTVTVTDSVGCSATASIYPTIRDTLFVDPIVYTNHCFNDNYNIIALHASSLAGGSGNLNYNWQGPGITSANQQSDSLTSLFNGDYLVQITSLISGCSITRSFNLNPSGSDNLTIESQPVGCNAGPSYARITGILPPPNGNVSYTWRNQSNTVISTTNAITNIPAGYYYVNVVLGNPSATYSACVYIGQESTPSVSLTPVTSVPCYLNQKVSAVVTGGVSPYIYSWSNTFTLPYVNTYTIQSSNTVSVTVQDFLGCLFTDSITPNYHPPLNFTIQQHQASCNANLVDVTITATGGVPPYTGDTGVHTVLPGTNSFTVRDSTGCTFTKYVTIQSYAYLQAYYTILTPATCTAPATVLIRATGGTTPYTGTDTLLLPIGTHTLIVSDSVGCSDTVTVSIPNPIQVNYTATSISCRSAYSTVNITVSGGVPPYNGNYGLYVLPAGTYNFTVSDAAGCAATRTISITRPDDLQAAFSGDTVPCRPGLTPIVVTATGGVTPYTGQIGVHNVAPGNYTYVVIDKEGCTDTVRVSVAQPVSLSGQFSHTICNDGAYFFAGQLLSNPGTYIYTFTTATGCDSVVTLTLYKQNTTTDTVDVTIQQGTVYTLPDGSTTSVPGTYTQTLLTTNGCDSIITTNLTVVAGIGNNLSQQAVDIYPNPASTALYISTTLQLQTITVYNTTGQQVMGIDKPQHLAGSNNYKLNIELLAAGTYVLQLTTNNTQLRQRWVKL